jgi:putative membrane protein
MSRNRGMGRLAWAASAAGLALFAALIVAEGGPGIVAAFRRAGWALLLVVPARVVTQALDVRAWRLLLEPFDPGHAAGPGFLLWVAFVREAVNRLLPVAGIGGEVVGVRLACRRIPDTAAVAASVVVEVLMTIAVLYVFCGLGAVLMLGLAGKAGQVGIIAAALALSLPLPLLAGWWLARGAPFARLERWMRGLLGPQYLMALHLDGVHIDAAVKRLFGEHGRLVRAALWSLLAYVLGTFETWFALALLGHPVGVRAALAIEALTQAVRHAGFMVPAGLGVQEAAVLLFGQLAGVGGDVALALALVKRMREIVTGVPALVSWHWVELRRPRRPIKVRDYEPPGI